MNKPGLLLALLMATGSAVAKDCPSIRATTPELVRYLTDHETRREDAACISDTILYLEAKRDPEAAPVLSQYLDFARPITPGEKEGINPFGRARYPAVTALADIGKPALPSLIKVIRNNDSNSLVFKNAVAAEMSIHRADVVEGVEYLLVQAAKEQASTAAKFRIAAEQATRRCADKKDACLALLEKTRN
jgi:hypothetical protein